MQIKKIFSIIFVFSFHFILFVLIPHTLTINKTTETNKTTDCLLNENKYPLSENKWRQTKLDESVAQTNLKIDFSKENILLPDKAITSFHEAGHIIIILLYPETFKFKHSDIILLGDSDGHTYFKTKRSNWKKTVILDFAGAVSEQYIASKGQMRKEIAGLSASADNKDADKLLQQNSRNSSDIRTNRELLRSKCQRLIELNQIPLIKIAEQLFIKKEIFREDVNEIINNYPLNYSLKR